MGFFGDPMANAYSDAMKGASLMYSTKQDARQKGKQRFNDLINRGIQEASDIHRQNTINDTSIETQEMANTAAYTRLGQEYKLKKDLSDYESNQTGKIVDDLKTFSDIATNDTGVFDADKFSGLVDARFGEANNPKIAALANAVSGGKYKPPTTLNTTSVAAPMPFESQPLSETTGTLKPDGTQSIESTKFFGGAEEFAPSTPEEAEAASSGLINVDQLRATQGLNRGLKNATINNKNATAAKNWAEAAAFGDFMGTGVPGPQGVQQGVGGFSQPTTPEEAMWMSKYAATGGVEPDTEFSVPKDLQESLAFTGLAPGEGKTIASPDMPPDLIGEATGLERTKQGQFPAFSASGEPLLTTSAKDGQTREPIFIPTQALKDRKEMNYLKAKRDQAWKDAAKIGKFDSSTRKLVDAAYIIRDYADKVFDDELRQNMGFVDKINNDGSGNGILGLAESYLVNAATWGTLVEQSAMKISNPEERVEFQSAMNEFRNRALTEFKSEGGSLGQVSIPELQMVRDVLMPIFGGRGMVGKAMEKNIFTFLGDKASINYALGNDGEFANLVNEYNQAANIYGYGGYQYSQSVRDYSGAE
jgi:hypothetical protein